MSISFATARKFGTSFLTILALVNLVLSIVARFFPDDIPLGWSSFLVVGVFSFVATVVLSLPKTRISAHLSSPDTAIEIRRGDLFEEKGHIVVGTNDCFDTELGDIISQRSVQGQFLQRKYDNDLARLDTDIGAAMSECQVQGAVDDQKKRGKPTRYAIGTVLPIKSGNSYCFLVAYTRMGNDLICQSDADCIWHSLAALWVAVRGKGECREVSIPVVGSELARTGLRRQTLIELIALSFIVASKRKPVSKKLSIVVHQSDMQQVDFQELEQFLKIACF